jgi:hypothetical protein
MGFPQKRTSACLEESSEHPRQEIGAAAIAVSGVPQAKHRTTRTPESRLARFWRHPMLISSPEMEDVPRAPEMTTGFALKTITGTIAAVLLAITLRQLSALFALLMLARFIVVISWPLQQRLQSRMPQLLALGSAAILSPECQAPCRPSRLYSSCSRSSFGAICGDCSGPSSAHQSCWLTLAFCDQHSSSRWLAHLLGGPKQTKIARP